MSLDEIERMIASLMLSKRDERKARDLLPRLSEFMYGLLDEVAGETDDAVMVHQAVLAMALAAGEASIADIRREGTR